MKTKTEKETSPEDNLPPNERQVFGDWSAEIVWRHANLGKKDNFKQVGRCTARLLYNGEEMVSSNHRPGYLRAVEMAQFFHERGHVPKPVPKVRGDYLDHKTRIFKQA